MKRLILAACMVFLTATWSQAYSLYVGSQYSSPIYSIVNGKQISEGGGSIDQSVLDGRKLDYLYCVDLFTNVYVNNTYNNSTVNSLGIIHAKQVNNAGEVAWLLANYGTGGQGEQAQALQAAIWTVINPGVYSLDINKYLSLHRDSLVNLYNEMLQKSDGKTGDVSDFLWINPGKYNSSTAYQGLVTSAPVPEPGTMVLLGVGMLGLAIFGKRRMNK